MRIKNAFLIITKGKIMGMIANVYRNGAPCALNAIHGDGVCLINVAGPFEPSDKYPAATLCAGYVKGSAIIKPVTAHGKRGMFGGAYVATSDSRFSEAVEKLIGAPFYGAVPLHDRFE